MANGSSNLRAWLVRLGVLALGLLGIVAVALLHRFAHLGLGLTLGLEYAAITCVVWGLNGFVLRTLPLSGATLLVFSAAVFGVLFLVGYFVRDVLGPFMTGLAWERAHVGYARLRRAFGRLGVLVTSAGSEESVPLILGRLQRLHSTLSSLARSPRRWLSTWLSNEKAVAPESNGRS